MKDIDEKLSIKGYEHMRKYVLKIWKNLSFGNKWSSIFRWKMYERAVRFKYNKIFDGVYQEEWDGKGVLWMPAIFNSKR